MAINFLRFARARGAAHHGAPNLGDGHKRMSGMRQGWLRLAAVAFSLGVWAAPVQAQDALSPGEIEAIEQVIEDYILDNPEVILRAVQRLEERERAQQDSDRRAAVVENRDALYADVNSHVAGNPHGDVTIVEFFDYRCPYCRRSLEAVQTILGEDANVRIVFKEFPVLGPDSLVASRAAIVAQRLDPTKYLAFHSALMSARGVLNKDAVLQIAAEVGLDAERLGAAMDSPEIDAVIEGNYVLAGALGVDGTPTFIIGEVVIPDAIDIDSFRAIIAEVRAGS